MCECVLLKYTHCTLSFCRPLADNFASVFQWWERDSATPHRWEAMGKAG